MTESLLDNLILRRSGRLSCQAFERRVTRLRCRHLALSKFRVIGVGPNTSLEEDGSPNVPIHSGAVTALDLETQDHRYVLAGNGDGTVYIHDTANIGGGGTPRHASKLIAKIKRAKDNSAAPTRQPAGLNSSSGSVSNDHFGHTKCISSVQWFPDDSGLFITSAMDGKLKVWDANVLEPVEEFALASDKVFSHHVRRSPSPLVAVGTGSNHINLIDLKSGSTSHELRAHSSPVMAVKWSPFKDHLLVSGDHEGKALVWDVRRAKSCLSSLDFDKIKKSDNKKSSKKSGFAHKGCANGIAFLDDGLHLLTYGSFDGRLRKWELGSGLNTKTKFPRFAPNLNFKVELKFATSFGCQGGDVAYIPVADTVVLLDVMEGERLATLTGHFNDVNCCLFNSQTQELISGGCDRNVLLWHPNAQQTTAFEDHLREGGAEGSSRKAAGGQDAEGCRDYWSSSSSDEEPDNDESD